MVYTDIPQCYNRQMVLRTCGNLGSNLGTSKLSLSISEYLGDVSLTLLTSVRGKSLHQGSIRHVPSQGTNHDNSIDPTHTHTHTHSVDRERARWNVVVLF